MLNRIYAAARSRHLYVQLVDIRTQALRETFDTIHDVPTNLHAVLAANVKVLLFPIASSDFDTTPLVGWDTLPSVIDLIREADIARVKYFRN